MSEALLLLSIWALLAGAAGVVPRGRLSPVINLALVVAGIPILGLVTMQMGPWAGLVTMAAGSLLLLHPELRADRAPRASSSY